MSFEGYDGSYPPQPWITHLIAVASVFAAFAFLGAVLFAIGTLMAEMRL